MKLNTEKRIRKEIKKQDQEVSRFEEMGSNDSRRRAYAQGYRDALVRIIN